MPYEQPESKSEGYGLHEEWEAIGELGGMIGEFTVLPVEILGDLVGEAFEGFTDADTQ